MASVVVGVDVACSRQKRIPIVFAQWQGARLVPLPVRQLAVQPPFGQGNRRVIDDAYTASYAEQVRAYIDAVCDHYQLQIACIGIDAPLRPRAEQLSFRLAEQALADAGIRCYKTPSATEFRAIVDKAQQHLAARKPVANMPHVMQLWMLAGFALAEQLAELAPLIEVFPQATIRQLLPQTPHKTALGVPEQQLAAIAQHSGWPATENEWQQLPQISFGSTHDKVDAYSAAWVAGLKVHAPHRLQVFGEVAQDDAIWVPRAV